jgi:hypothetical protein
MNYWITATKIAYENDAGLYLQVSSFPHQSVNVFNGLNGTNSTQTKSQQYGTNKNKGLLL